MQLLRPIDDAMAAKNYAAAAAGVEKAVAKKPELFYSLAANYLVALYHADLKKGMTVSRKILTDSQGAPGAYQMISSIFATQPDLSPEAYKFGVGILDEAIQKWPQDFLYTAMKADIVFRLGDKAQAIKLAQSALDAAQKRPEIPAKIIELIQKNIARYQAAK
jgi:hypothetical protein